MVLPQICLKLRTEILNLTDENSLAGLHCSSEWADCVGEVLKHTVWLQTELWSVDSVHKFTALVTRTQISIDCPVKGFRSGHTGVAELARDCTLKSIPWVGEVVGHAPHRFFVPTMVACRRCGVGSVLSAERSVAC